MENTPRYLSRRHYPSQNGNYKLRDMRRMPLRRDGLPKTLLLHLREDKPYIATIEKEKKKIRAGSNITISLDTALLGHPGRAGPTPNILPINYLITLAKMCISKYRDGDTIPIELIFERELRLRDLISQTAPTPNQSANTVDQPEIPRTTSIPTLAKR